MVCRRPLAAELWGLHVGDSFVHAWTQVMELDRFDELEASGRARQMGYFPFGGAGHFRGASE